MSDPKLDEILAAVRTLTDNAIEVDQNLTVLKASVEAEAVESASFRREVRSTLGRLEAAVTELSRDVVQIRERITEVDSRASRRLKVLENGHGKT